MLEKFLAILPKTNKQKQIEQSLRNRHQVTPVNILFYEDKVYSQINNLFGFILQFTFINCII